MKLSIGNDHAGTEHKKEIIDLEKKISTIDEKPNFIGEELRKRQYLSYLFLVSNKNCFKKYKYR